MENSSFFRASQLAANASASQWHSVIHHMMSFAGSDEGHNSHTNHDESHVHPHVALLFPFCALLLGALTMGFLSRCLPSVPYTVVMLIEGFLIGWIDERHSRGHLGLFDESLAMWTDMDPHLLLFAFLPALLFADSMSLNWHMWKRCLGQCLLLAGPGVLMGTGMAALFAKFVLPYEWSWARSAMFGSILAATDPVAVVGILKELGASPKLTMCVSGESLLNDGTAIVLFNLFHALAQPHDMVSKALDEVVGYHEIDAFLVGKYFCWVALGGVIIGALCGCVFVMIIGKFNQRTMHNDSLIQITATLVQAYLTFFISEAIFHVSGVLATVSSALVFAACGWPYLANRETLESFWHMLEYILNTVIFFLAGLIMGDAFGEDQNIYHHLRWIDFMYLIMLYVGMLAIRGIMVACLFPFLSRMGYTLDWRDAFMLSWGGLRGALALALALDVDIEFSKYDKKYCLMGSRMLFHVAGFAMLTLLINGTTSSFFLNKLGMTASDSYQKTLISHVEGRVQDECEKVLDERAKEILRSDSEEDLEIYRQHVFERVQVLQHVQATFTIPCESQASHLAVTRTSSRMSRSTSERRAQRQQLSFLQHSNRSNALRQMFLAMLRSRYMELIEKGILENQGQLIIILMNSVDVAFDKSAEKLCDWESIKKACNTDTMMNGIRDWAERRLPNWLLLTELFENAGVAISTHNVCSLLLCFVHAHNKNQESMEELLVDISLESAEGQDVQAILQESRDEEKMAQELIASMDESLVQAVKVTILTNAVLESERHFIMRLVHEGALQEKQAHHLLEGIAHDLQRNAKRNLLSSRRATHGSSNLVQTPSRTSRHGLMDNYSPPDTSFELPSYHGTK